MKTSLKFILLSLLLVLALGMKSDVVDFAVVSEAHCTDSDNTCEMLASSSVSASELSSTNVVDAFNDRMRLMSFSDMEMGFKLVTETYSFNGSRMRRAVETSDFFKHLVHGLCLRENLLVLDKSMSCRLDKAPHSTQSSCDYYIFALRRIII